ncbi:hypothetical protein ABZP36_033331 [Zizania latifolia]
MEETLMGANPNPNASSNPPPRPPPSSAAGTQLSAAPPAAGAAGAGDGAVAGAGTERRARPQKEKALNCPRCNSTNTKFCYYNNYSLQQPRFEYPQAVFSAPSLKKEEGWCNKIWSKRLTISNLIEVGPR